jgi:hypothetical protein
MKNRFITAVLLVVLLTTLTGNAQASPNPVKNQVALIYVHLGSTDDITRFASTGLPMYVLVEGALLTGADLTGQEALQEAGLMFQVLDPNLETGDYYLVGTHFNQPVPNYTAYGKVLLKTGSGVLMHLEPSQVNNLTQAGAELRTITLTPKPLPGSDRQVVSPEIIEPDPIIQGMIDQVTQTQVYTYDEQLAGYLPVWADGDWYTIPTRYTYSGIPIQKTTHFVGQHLQDLGLDVEYHMWNASTNPNVIGQITGTTHPEDIYIIGGHLDDVQGAPGADDNASGAVATLLAADIISQYQWGCTLRFAFWTGEEQGLWGSEAYAWRAYQHGENIQGYLNLDMIAWNTRGSPAGIDVIYNSSMPETYALAQLFADVIDAYNINLIPGLGTSLGGGSDHSSFWDYGYTAILSIEDQSDFNPYYHSSQDTPAHMDPTYFTNFVKAAVATFAHQTGCLIPPAEGALNGHVTRSSDGSPIAGGLISASNNLGGEYQAISDPGGYYTMTLPVDSYSVTVTADGYVPAVAGGVEIISGTTTTQDFALETSCEPISNLDFTWTPPEPYSLELITFTATAESTPPIDFQWDLGDGITTTGQVVTHTYEAASTYQVMLSASNICDTQQINKDVTVLPREWEYFLPVVNK